MSLETDFQTLRLMTGIINISDVSLTTESGQQKVVKVDGVSPYDPIKMAETVQFIQNTFNHFVLSLQKSQQNCTLLLNKREVKALVQALKELSLNTVVLERFLQSPIAKSLVPTADSVKAAKSQIAEHHKLIKLHIADLIKEIKQLTASNVIDPTYAPLFQDLIALLKQEKIEIDDPELQKLYAKHWIKNQAGPLRTWLEYEPALFERIQALPIQHQSKIYEKSTAILPYHLSNDSMQNCREIIKNEEQKKEYNQARAHLKDPDLIQLLDLHPWKSGYKWIPAIIELWDRGEQDLVKEMLTFFARKGRSFDFNKFAKFVFCDKDGRPFEPKLTETSLFRSRFEIIKDYVTALPADTWDSLAIPWLMDSDKASQRIIPDIVHLKMDEEDSEKIKILHKLYDLAAKDPSYTSQWIDLYVKYPEHSQKILFLWKTLDMSQLMLMKPFMTYVCENISYPDNTKRIFEELKILGALMHHNKELILPLLQLPKEKFLYFHAILGLVKDIKELTRKDIKQFFKSQNAIDLYFDLYVPSKNKSVWQAKSKRLFEANPQLIGPLKNWMDALYFLHQGSHSFSQRLKSINILKSDDKVIGHVLEKVFDYDAPVGRNKQEKSYSIHSWPKTYWPLLERMTKWHPEQVSLALEFAALYPLLPRLQPFFDILEKDRGLAEKCLIMAKENPSLLPTFFNIYKEVGYDLAKQLMEKWHSGNRQEITQAMQTFGLDRNSLETLFAIDVLNPSIIPQLTQIFSGANYFSFNLIYYPTIFNRMLSDPKFSKEVLEIVDRTHPNDFPKVLKNLQMIMDLEESTGLEFVSQAHEYPVVLKELLGEYLKPADSLQPSLRQLLNKLNKVRSDKRDPILKSVLGLLENGSKELSLINRLVDLAASGKPGWSFLVERLLDMVYAGYAPEVNQLLDKSLEADKTGMADIKEQFIQSLRISANSIDAETIREALLLDLDKNRPLLDYIVHHELKNKTSFSNLAKGMITLASQGKSELLTDVLKAAQTLESNRTMREKALLTWTEERNFALAEWVIKQPAALWEKDRTDLSPRMMEQLWDIQQGLQNLDPQGNPAAEMQVVDTQKCLSFCLALSNIALSESERWDALGMVQYLLKFDRPKLKEFIESDAFKNGLIDPSKVSEIHLKLQMLLESSAHSPQAVINDLLWKTFKAALIYNFEFGSEHSYETMFTVGLARCLITIGGGVNLAMIERLKAIFLYEGEPQSALSKLLRIKQWFPPGSDFNLHLIETLDGFKANAQDMSMMLSQVKASAVKNSQMVELLKHLFHHVKRDKDLTDEDTRVAILSALLTRIRQKNNLGSCFGTQTAIQTHSTQEMRHQSLKDYIELLTTGALKRNIPGINFGTRQYPLTIDPEQVHTTSQINLHPISRAREFTIAQMGAQSEKEQLYKKNLDFYEAKEGARHPIFNNLVEIINLNPSPVPELNAALFAEQLKQQILKISKVAFQPWGVREGMGFWGIAYGDEEKKIRTPDDYANFFHQVNTLAVQELKKKYTREDVKAYIDLVMDKLDSSTPKIVKAAIELEEGSQSVHDPLTNYWKLKTLPWGFFEGGFPNIVQQHYFQLPETPVEYTVQAGSPAQTYRYALEYVLDYPKNLQDSILTNPGLLIPHGYYRHAANLSPHDIGLELFLKKKSPKDIIAEGLQEAQTISDQLLTKPLKKDLIKRFAALYPNYALLPYLEETVANAKTLSDFCALVSERLSQLGLSTKENYFYENLLRESLIKAGFKVPSVTRVLDLNYPAEGHNNQYLGFSPSIYQLNSFCQFIVSGPKVIPQAVSMEAYGRGFWRYTRPARRKI